MNSFRNFLPHCLCSKTDFGKENLYRKDWAELKNDLSICCTLHSVDQYLNIKRTDVSVTDPEKYPHRVREDR